jgi:hypothetical protein
MPSSPNEHRAVRRSRKTVGLILAIPVVVLAVYAVLAGWTNLLPMSADNTGSHLLVILLVFGVLLVVPYLILKAGFHAAHLNNPAQKELKLEDIPKEEKPPYTGA